MIVLQWFHSVLRDIEEDNFYQDDNIIVCFLKFKTCNYLLYNYRDAIVKREH